MPRDTGAVMGRLAEELVVPQAYRPVTQQLAADASHSRVVHHIMKSCHPSATYTIISMCAIVMTLAPMISKNAGTVQRLGHTFEVLKTLSGMYNGDKTQLRNSTDGDIVLDSVTVITPKGNKLACNVDLRLVTGDRLLIKGPSGCGKSSLLRMLGGLWPLTSANGRIFRPEVIGNGGMLLLPQKPYFPLRSFRDQIIYPDSISRMPDEALGNILRRVNMGYVLDRSDFDWDQTKEWGVVLSGGEQQRVAFARVLYHVPRFAILDESTSALDEENEALMYKLLREEGISSMSVGHRETLDKLHDKLLVLDRNRCWKLFDEEIKLD